MCVSPNENLLLYTKVYYSIFILTLLQKTLLHEKYLSQGFLIFNKLIL